MEAKNELISELSILFPGDENLEKLTIVINRYTVARGTDSGRSNLKKEGSAVSHGEKNRRALI